MTTALVAGLVAGLLIALAVIVIDARRERADHYRVFVATVDKLLAQAKEHALERAHIEERHRGELRELLNRLYHPEHMPVAAERVHPPVESLRDRAQREWASVGTAAPVARPPIAPAPVNGSILDPEVP